MSCHFLIEILGIYSPSRKTLKFLSLLVDFSIKKLPLEALSTARDSLLLELHAIYVGASSTTYSGYLMTQHALKIKEDMTFSDEEIDAFLAQYLKKIKTKPSWPISRLKRN